jgi:hypothetical protein
VPAAKLSEEEIDHCLHELDDQLDRRSPYVLLFDLTHSATPNALQRQKLANHVRVNTPKIRRWVRGVGVVLSSPLTRGIVTALFWVAPPPVPHRIFATRAEADAWAESLTPSAIRG